MLSLNGKRQPRLDLRVGDALVRLREIPDASVHCCVTSPPYWGLRDYGIEGQIGREEMPSEYVGKIVDVFREVRRALRDDGTLWLNLGDTYASAWVCSRRSTVGAGSLPNGKREARLNRLVEGMKEKDLIGIPWLVAFALRDDGWYLRQDVIWSKGNCMPESVKDRCTRSHEYLFMLTKNSRYYYDADAISEQATCDRTRGPALHPDTLSTNGNAGLSRRDSEGVRNKRSVWNVNPRPFEGAHFATFPPDLIRPCILAGTSEYGACGTCGAPWSREVEVLGETRRQRQGRLGKSPYAASQPENPQGLDHTGHHGNAPRQHTQLGWKASCSCPSATLVPCTVLDPFGGAGTTAYVALEQWRDCITIELNPDYAKIIEKRTWPLLSQQRFL